MKQIKDINLFINVATILAITGDFVDNVVKIKMDTVIRNVKTRNVKPENCPKMVKRSCDLL